MSGEVWQSLWLAARGTWWWTPSDGLQWLTLATLGMQGWHGSLLEVCRVEHTQHI